MNFLIKFFIIFFCLLFFINCSEENDEDEEGVICNLIFNEYTVKVLNDTLDDYYTTRPSIMDTINADGHTTFPDSTYIVLSDAYHSDLVSQKDSFFFHGIIQDSIVIKEKYLFEADQCHVYIVSGPEEVSI